MSLLNKVFGRQQNKKNAVKKHPARKRALRVETLEDRKMLTTVLYGGDDGYVTIESFGDSWVSYGGSEEPVQDFDLLKIGGSDGNDKVVVTNSAVYINGKMISLPADIEIEMIKFYGGNGDDTFNNITNTYSQALGGNGNDRLYGGYGKDELIGGDGFDRLFGRAGEDWLNGGAGADWLYGGADNDVLIGDDGNDFLFGDSGDDFLTGGAGSDWLDGGYGNDSLFGDNAAGSWSENTQQLFGHIEDTPFIRYYRMRGGAGDGNDVLDGGRQRSGEADRDELYGEGGKDSFVNSDRAGVEIADFDWWDGDRTMQRDSERYDASYNHRRYIYDQQRLWNYYANYYYGRDWNAYYNASYMDQFFANYVPAI